MIIQRFITLQIGLLGISECDPGDGGTPLYGLLGKCSPKGFGFSAVLVINRVWFLYSSLDMGMFLS